MNVNLHQSLRYIVLFLVSLVGAFLLSFAGSPNQPAVATAVNLLGQPATSVTLSDWRDPSHQELNYYQ